MPETEKNKILIVEDNIESQLIFKVYLREDYDVEISGDAEQGWELLHEKEFSLLILDINLPGKMDGGVLLDMIRKDTQLNTLPVIVITAYAMGGDKEVFYNKGANEYLTKPVEKVFLQTRVKSLISK